MGVENNEAVLATTWDDKSINTAKAWIDSLDEPDKNLFVIIRGIANHKQTIVLAPSGSKKGWATDLRIEKLRKKFIEFLKSFNYEDDSSPFDWVEVSYGEFGQEILQGNCKYMY